MMIFFYLTTLTDRWRVVGKWCACDKTTRKIHFVYITIYRLLIFIDSFPNSNNGPPWFMYWPGLEASMFVLELISKRILSNSDDFGFYFPWCTSLLLNDIISIYFNHNIRKQVFKKNETAFIPFSLYQLYVPYFKKNLVSITN